VAGICRRGREGKAFAWVAQNQYADDVPTEEGQPWMARQIFRIVHNPRPRGNVQSADVLSPRTHPASVTGAHGREGRES